MTTREKLPPRRWEIDDLLDLGKKGGVTYLKAIPVLFLEEWVRQGQSAKIYVRTKALERRLVDSGLHRPFPPKGTSNIFGALGSIQKDRNLTNPPLMKSKTRGGYWINLEDYKDLLEEFRQEYCNRFPEDYKKLFPKGEAQWKSLSFRGEHQDTQAIYTELEVQGDIKSLIAPIVQALSNREKEITRLIEKNQNLEVRLATIQTALEERHEVPYDPIMDEELRNDCANQLKNKETYSDAIRRASVVLEERIRKTIGGDGPEKFMAGNDLVNYALLPKSGKLIIREHPAEQEGVCMLFRGALQFIRNPTAHKKVQYTELEVWQNVSLIDHLLMLLQQAKLRVT